MVVEGGRYSMLCFSEHEPGDWGPHRVTQAEIRAEFAEGWAVTSIEASDLVITLRPNPVRAVVGVRSFDSDRDSSRLVVRGDDVRPASTAPAMAAGSPSSGRSTSSGCAGGLVRVVDAGEALELAGAGLGVEALGVALLAELDRRVDEHLDEREIGRGVELPHRVAVGPVGAHERHERDEAGVGHQGRDVADAADVLGSVLGAEAEVAVEAVADVVAVEHVGRPAGGDEPAPRRRRRRWTCPTPTGR